MKDSLCNILKYEDTLLSLLCKSMPDCSMVAEGKASVCVSHVRLQYVLFNVCVVTNFAFIRQVGAGCVNFATNYIPQWIMYDITILTEFA